MSRALTGSGSLRRRRTLGRERDRQSTRTCPPAGTGLAGAARGRGELRRAEVREHSHAARTVGASRKKMQMRKHGLQVPESIIGPFRAPLEKDSHWQTEFDPWLEGT